MAQNNQDIVIKHLDKTSIVEQIHVVYSNDIELCLNDYLVKWESKQYKNPLGDSLVFGAYLDGKLVGMNAYMPMEYNYQGQKVKLLQSCDSKVLEECRGKGIWGKLVTFAVDYIFSNTDYACIIGFPNYSNSYPGFVKMKWQTIDHMKNYVMVNNDKALAKLFSNKSFLKRCLARLAGMQRLIINYFKSRGFSVEKCGFEDLLWDDVEDKMCVEHTTKWLEWKRVYKSIKTLVIKYNGKSLGSCVYSVGKYEGREICIIEKFVTARITKRNKKKTLASLLYYLKQQEPNAAFVRTWTMGGEEFDSLCKSCLFIKSSHSNPFIIKQPSTVFNGRIWHLSFLDLD